MELLRYFAAHRPARTMKFNWFGSEEQGLLGLSLIHICINPMCLPG